MSLLFCSEDGQLCLTLAENVVEKISQLAAQWAPLETGGVLLGHIDDNLRHVTVIEASPPPSDSTHGRFKFFRGTRGLEALLAWGLTQNPPLQYLGEWHSHPGGSPYPSSTDVRQLKEFADKKVFGSATPVMVIIGGRTFKDPNWRATLISGSKKLITMLPYR